MINTFGDETAKKLVKLANPRQRRGMTKVVKQFQSGQGVSTSDVFAVALEHDGGVDGSATTEASWSYRVALYNTPDVIIEALVNPGIPRHEYRRGLGLRTKATSGTAIYNADGELVILTTNEIMQFSTCE
jgi:hypothetical protein